ncbi:glycerophosphoryl diester phosphodiesterase membrane domain-containing protein [Clostridium sp. D2Q-11]|uniref:Glycerophosphoryl diester phosphodiesterase membrane domain-containing protein n=2 Tax=Anaeromonas frigoriresistens TaxID=2683708 RepID=A0A942Z9N5_9FIRM|nr:glycerophosphoryl diester phosphodiesterase membrane domain-containing protein [Anaeromonas frigoriresistens]
MYAMLKNSLEDFSKLYKKYILFELIFMIVSSFLFVPLISYIYSRILISMGSRSLINNDILKIVLSYEGIIGLLIVAILSVTFIFIEFGVLIIISQKEYFEKEISILNSFITILKKVPKILSIEILPLTILLLLLIPFIDLPMSSELVQDVDLQYYIRRKIIDSYKYLAIYITLIFSLGYIFLRLIFTFHCIVIEGKSTLESIKCSWELTDDNEISILIKLILFNSIIVMFGFFIISSLTFITNEIQYTINSNYLKELFITLSGYVTYALILLLLPVNVIFITRLYYSRNLKIEGKVTDKLVPYTNYSISKLENKFYNLLYNRRHIVILISIVALIITFSINYFLNKDIMYLGRNISVAGHRGDMVSAPENSLSSIRSALNKNIKYIEVDVQTTKDGIVILYHDINLRRLAGLSKNISELTYIELSEIDIGAGFSNKFEGERIPTLDDTLEEVKGKAQLIIELKAYNSNDELVEKVINIIEENNMESEVYIQSFDYNLLKKVRSINNNIKIGQIMYIAAGDLSYLDVDFYSIEKSMLSNKIIQHGRSNNREIWVWTVNNEDNIKETLKYDIDGIITDYPLKVKEIIEFSF